MKYDLVVWEERQDEYACVHVCLCALCLCVCPRLLHEYIQMVSRSPEKLKAIEQMIH